MLATTLILAGLAACGSVVCWVRALGALSQWSGLVSARAFRVDGF